MFHYGLKDQTYTYLELWSSGLFFRRYKGLLIPFIVQDLFHSLPFSATWRLLRDSQLELYFYRMLHSL